MRHVFEVKHKGRMSSFFIDGNRISAMILNEEARTEVESLFFDIAIYFDGVAKGEEGV